jgi:LEA14-like dessication related protein
VFVVGIEPMPGEGLEMRMNVKLRVQNPNDTPIDYNGVSLSMDLQGKSIASGVSDATGSVPRFGEAVIEVPITVSTFGLARGAASVFNTTTDKINYSLRGKLAGPVFKSVRFTSSGEVALPKDVYNTTK